MTTTPQNQDSSPEITDEERAVLDAAFEYARNGQTEELSAFLNAGLPANLTNEKGDTLLILAAYYSHGETVDALLAAGADTDRVNDRGQSALSAATFRKDEEVARKLLAAGADPKVGQVNALAVAQQFGLPEFVELFEQE